MDEMIDKLADKPYDLPNAVQRAFRVIESPIFIMRIAARADENKLTKRNRETTALCGQSVSVGSSRIDNGRYRTSERRMWRMLLKRRPNRIPGEFMVPLLPERVAAMRSALQAFGRRRSIRSLLNTIDADDEESRRWNGFNGGILQRRCKRTLEHPCGRKVGQQEQGIIVGSLQAV
jgi:hypothetical protein